MIDISWNHGEVIESYRLFLSPDMEEQAIRGFIRELQKRSPLLTNQEEIEDGYSLLNLSDSTIDEQMGVTARPDIIEISRGQNTDQEGFESIVSMVSSVFIELIGLDRIRFFDYGWLFSVNLDVNHFEKIASLYYSKDTIARLYDDLSTIEEERVFVLDNDILLNFLIGNRGLAIKIVGNTTSDNIIDEEFGEKPLRIWIGFLESQSSIANTDDLARLMLSFGLWSREFMESHIEQTILAPLRPTQD